MNFHCLTPHNVNIELIASMTSYIMLSRVKISEEDKRYGKERVRRGAKYALGPNSRQPARRERARRQDPELPPPSDSHRYRLVTIPLSTAEYPTPKRKTSIIYIYNPPTQYTRVLFDDVIPFKETPAKLSLMSLTAHLPT